MQTNIKSLDKEAELLFLKSALTLENPFNSTVQILNWVKKRNNEVHVNIERIGFNEMKNWFNVFLPPCPKVNYLLAPNKTSST